MSQNIPQIDIPHINLEEQDNELQLVLDALIQLRKEDETAELDETFEKDYENIDQAISLNEQLQRKITDHIHFIDKQLELNQKSMTDTRFLANAESRFGQRIYLHKQYDKDISYFDESELNEKTPQATSDSQEYSLQDEPEPVMEEDEEDGVDCENDLPSRAWSRYERNRLVNAIHAEAKRAIAFSFLKNDEEWRVWEVDKIDKETLENFPVERLDWERISTLHVLSRTGNQCLMQWTTQEHPIINKKPWSKQESCRLSELVDEIGLNGQWERIATELGTGRTISQCFSHYMAYKNNEQARSLKWTPEEDKELTETVKTFGDCNWQQVASMLKFRTGQQCLHRWEKSINPGIKRTKWTEEESELLKRAVQLYGLGNWTKVQRLLPGRTDMQCRERWVNVLRPEVEKGKMDEEDVQQLVSLVEQVGFKWSYIAGFFPGRTDNHLLRTYNVYKTRGKREAREKERLSKKEEKIRKKKEARAEKAKIRAAARIPKKKRGRPSPNECKKGKARTAKNKRKRKRIVISDDDDEEEEEEEEYEEGEESEVEEVEEEEDYMPKKKRKPAEDNDYQLPGYASAPNATAVRKSLRRRATQQQEDEEAH